MISNPLNRWGKFWRFTLDCFSRYHRNISYIIIKIESDQTDLAKVLSSGKKHQRAGRFLEGYCRNNTCVIGILHGCYRGITLVLQECDRGVTRVQSVLSWHKNGPFLVLSWLVGWLVGWLVCWLVLGYYGSGQSQCSDCSMDLYL